MKKTSILKVFITGVLLLTLVLSFGACATVTPSPSASASASVSASASPSASASAATATPAATTAAPSASPSASASPSTSLPTLIMVTNAEFPPYEYYENNQIVGIDAEIAQLIADKIGMKLQIQNMDFNSLIAAVQSGKADICMAGLTVREDRKVAVDFSTTYATGKQVIIVKESSKIAGPDGLKGKKIGVQQSTTGDIYCTTDYGDKAVVRFNKGADAVLALTQDKVDAVVIDNEPAKVFVSQNKGLKILPTEYITEDYAVAVNKGEPQLLDKINTALADLKTSGQLQAIISKYIKAD